jgi:hypothetical protein
MTLLETDPLTHLSFSVYENKGVYALLLGSGLSRSAEIPTGWEITLDLVRRVALAQGVEDQSDWAEWYRGSKGQEPNYSALLEEVALSPEERRSVLHSYIEPDEEDREAERKVPTLAHRAIARLVRAGRVRVIITTNFDRLMENALREQGIEPTVVSTVDALSGAEPITHSDCYILKLHGDYKDARILNTDSELSAYPAAYDRILDRIFDEYGLIVCGWSGEWDHALRSALLRAPSRRYPIYWAARGALGTGAQELVLHRGARVVPISSADVFFASLEERIDTLQQSHRKNPQSVELLVSATKRNLAKPEFRIQLDELFSSEVESLLMKLDSSEFSVQDSWSDAEFRARVRRYESACEPLIRMVGVLGRWGGDDEFQMVLDMVGTLYSQAGKIQNGLSSWLMLRTYPAVLVLTAYGLGLTRAQHWNALHRFLSEPIAHEHQEKIRLVDRLFLWCWDGAEERHWQLLEGLERHKTPFSDHLLELFTDWGKSFSSLEPDFEMMFERYEVLGSLIHFEGNDEARLEAGMAAASREPLTWMPLGRVGWHGKNLGKITEELKSEPIKQALLRDGYAKGKPRVLELFIENINRLASRMSWR